MPVLIVGAQVKGLAECLVANLPVILNGFLIFLVLRSPIATIESNGGTWVLLPETKVISHLIHKFRHSKGNASKGVSSCVPQVLNLLTTCIEFLDKSKGVARRTLNSVARRMLYLPNLQRGEECLDTSREIIHHHV